MNPQPGDVVLVADSTFPDKVGAVKSCTKCGETKPLDEFHRSNKGVMGRASRCRECIKVDDAVRYQMNRDSHLRSVAARRVKNPHYQWRSYYKESCRKFGLTPAVEDFTKTDVIERYGDRCFYCATGAFEVLDHYVPVVEGGAHSLSNVRPSCDHCNRVKHAVLPQDLAPVDGIVRAVCKHGHELVEGNTYYDKYGNGPRCTKCKKASARASYERKLAKLAGGPR